MTPATTAVHQLLPSFSSGDAIGNTTLRMRDMLRHLGFRSEIFAPAVESRIRHEARDPEALPKLLGPQDAVIYRLSIGSELAELFAGCPGRRILAYHNITPARYFKGNLRVAEVVTQGRVDLRRLAPVVDLVIGDSSFNLEEAQEAGARRCVVVPIAVDLERLRPRPSVSAAPPVVLFVGRMAPNKRHDTLLRALAALRALHIPQARLVVTGTAMDNEGYREQLSRLATALGVAEAVDMGGERIGDERVGDLYASAAVFASASEHEGFCVPVVEAMAFDLPIVAFRTGAVPETAGPAGLILDDRDPLLWARTLATAIQDHELRSALIAAGRAQRARFSLVQVQEQLRQALSLVGVHSPRAQGAPPSDAAVSTIARR